MPTNSTSHSHESSSPAARPRNRGPLGGGTLAEDQAAEVVRQIGAIARAGLPLSTGLRALAEELRAGPLRGQIPRLGFGRRNNRLLRRLLHELADDIEAGVPLDEALASQGNRFPAHLRGLILAGSRSGRLSDMLAEFLAHYQAGDAIRRRVWLGLFYPAILLLTCVGTFALLASMLSDGVFSIFESFGVDLPMLSRAMVQVAGAFAGMGIWVVLGPLVVGLMVWLLERALFRPAERRRQLLAIPLIGPLWRWSALAEFCHALAALTEAELPLVEALPLSGRAARDPALEEACDAAARDLADGRSLADALDHQRAFPEGLARFLRWAEGQRSLPEALELAAGIFEARARSHGTFTATFLGLLTVVIVLWWMALIYVAIIWPLLQLLVRFAF